MNKHTKKRLKNLTEIYGQDKFADMMFSIMAHGTLAFDEYKRELGGLMAEAIMLMDREEVAGPDYHPKSKDIQKWASQQGSIFVGGEKLKVNRPRLRGPNGEISLKTYEALKQPDTFSEALLLKILSGLSGRQYRATLAGAAEAFGVSPSSVSNHIVNATTAKLKDFTERKLTDIDLVAILIDGVHRGGAVFTVAIGVDIKGQKHALGFWEGATENHEVCKELLNDLEERGLNLTNKVLYVTDGGTGIIKALRDKFGKKLAHQRCTIHKDTNIQKHLPKKYRKQAHNRFQKALELTKYSDAKAELESFERWLRPINESAANSLQEAFEELLTLHSLNASALLRRSLHTTNIIESTFARLRDCEKNIKRYRNSKMAQRWLAAVLLHCEKTFHRLEGYKDLPILKESIVASHEKIDKEAK